MRFLSPGRLVLLIAPLALVSAYVIAQRARQKYAVRFTSVDLLTSVIPRRPGWQRHIGPAVLIAALTMSVVAFARPARAQRVPRQRATVILALDTSASMGADDVAPSRLAAAEESARRFVSGLTPGLRVGLVAFDSSARVLVSPTNDRATVLDAISNLTLGQGTNTGDAIALSLDTIKTQPGTTGAAAAGGAKKVPAAVVLMSDGTPTLGRGDQTAAETVASAAAAAKAAGVPINTIAFGTPDGTITIRDRLIAVPYDPDAMAEIAKATNGKTFTARNAGQLRSVYAQIGRLVGYDTVTRELTAGFTGAAMALLIAAAGAALWWMQRLV
jgi:Ca-activated chloride channel family protein